MSNYDDMAKAVAGGEADEVKSLVQKAIDGGQAPADILNQGLISAMEAVGKRFQAHEIFLPHVLLAAKAMKAGLEILRPSLAASGVEPVGKVAIGTVKGDIHDIGQNLVGMMLEGAGFAVEYLGCDVKPERFVEAARGGARIVGLSALLTTTMPAMKETIDALAEAGLRDKVKVIIGGAPVDKAYCDEIGADGYGPDAATSVEMAKGLV